jgi:peptidoglycan/LPS O-acetylase OafA/YrhL
MFFTLSGFLITWLLLKEEARFATVSLRLFYIRRTLRIFPAFYFFCAVYIIVRLFQPGKHISLTHILPAVFYVNDYYQAFTHDWSSPFFHTWSLAIEEQFYLLWPLAFILLKTNQRRLRALLVIIPGLWVYRLTLIACGVSQNYIYAALDTRADHLLIGCALAVMLIDRKWAGFLTLLTGHKLAYLVTLGLLAASSTLTLAFGTGYRDCIGFILDPLLTAMLLVQGMAAAPLCLNWSPIRYVGRISYSMYLWHMVAAPAGLKLAAHLPSIVGLIFGVAAVVLAGTISFYVVERPFLALKDRVSRRRT